MEIKVALRFLLLSAVWLHSARSDGDCVEGEENCSVHAESEDSRHSLARMHNNILILTDDNFDEVITKEETILATFYAPWCRHCIEALTVFEEAAASLSPHGISLGKLDIKANEEIKKKYQIKHVPDARIFRKGVMFPYEGPGDSKGVQAVVDYMLEEKLKHNTSAVLILTEDNFDNILEVSPIVLVEFFADWCSPCLAMEPIFHAAARRLLKNIPPIILGQVRLPDQLELAKRFTIGNYPLLIMFRYGHQYEYNGPKEDEDGIVRYMLRQAGPSSKLLDSVSDVNNFVPDEAEPRAVAFLPEGEELDIFKEVGNNVRMFLRLGHCNDPEVARSMGFKMGSVVVFRSRNLVSKYEAGHSVISSSLLEDMEEAVTLLLQHASPLVGEMTKDNQLVLFGKRPLLVVYYDINWDSEIKKVSSYWHNIVASVAKDFIDRNISFAIANEADFPVDIKIMGLEDWGEDISVGIFAPHNIRYPMNDELSPDTLLEFVNEFFNGNLQPYLRSEPVPRKSKKTDLIQRVVGTTFEKFMYDSSKSSLIKLCMEEAHKCEDAEKHFYQIAMRYEGSKEVMLGEMNMALNDVPAGTVLDDELPTYLFCDKGSKDLVLLSPSPTDDSDILFFLKHRNHLYPTVSDRELDQRARRQEKQKEERERKKKEMKEEL